MIYLSIVAVWAWVCVASSHRPIVLFLTGPFFILAALVLWVLQLLTEWLSVVMSDINMSALRIFTKYVSKLHAAEARLYEVDHD